MSTPNGYPITRGKELVVDLMVRNYLWMKKKHNHYKSYYLDNSCHNYYCKRKRLLNRYIALTQIRFHCIKYKLISYDL